MEITRRFTKPGKDVYDAVEWEKRTSRITDADGKVVFEMLEAEVPKAWSQLATDIMVSKYFRKAGIPQVNEDGTPRMDEAGKVVTGSEPSARQVINRLVGCWRHWGETYGYFDSRQDAEAFYDELAHMLVHQMAAPNSPQWFNTGINWAYGITGPPQGHWVADPATGQVSLAPDAYGHPQPHACFIQSIKDDLVGEGGIMDVWVREARLFKYGSGTGTNFSTLRGENEALSGGGKSSGLMSFLRIGDRAAGAIKSGGTTRRAAKMVCLNADHPDIEAFVNWKVREELKVAAMVEGLKHLPKQDRELAERLGLELTYDFNGEAYYTVSGQNSNNSIRLPDAFFDAIDDDGDWQLIRRTDGQISKIIKARDLWEQICFAAWRCADPGLQYDSTINAWHTCPASGRINASNPCSEYMFLDNTACNLASINLLKFYDADRRVFDTEGFEHAIRLWTIVLEISVLMASYPSREIAERSYRFRTLGLGYANLGALLMQAGVPYDSDEARAICGALTAILTGRSYATSAEMAKRLGPFPGFAENREHMLHVIRNHQRAAHGVSRESEAYEELHIKPVPIDHALFEGRRLNITNAEQLLRRATQAWDEALELGENHGYRNAQTTVIAPTGTIGLLMDCDTTGVEPDFALTKFKKLAGGGYFKIANQSLRPALHALGYSAEQVDDILAYVMGTLSLDTPMPQEGRTFREFLTEHGYRSEDIVDLENQLPTVFELSFAFSAWSMPAHVLESLGVDAKKARTDPSFNGLRALGLDAQQIEALNRVICGTQTVERAPHLKDAHLAVFDCANRCGKTGKRFIATQGHIRMMAAAQPFVSGAISKTINLPAEAAVEDIASAYRLSWELGLKANALYRDGSKLSQPLRTKADEDKQTDEEKHAMAVEVALGEASTEVAAAVSVTSTSSTSSASPAPAAPAPPTSQGTETLDPAPDSPPVSASVNGDGPGHPEPARKTDSPPDAPTEEPVRERIVERIVERPLRRRLPDTRRSITHRFDVAGHEGYLTVGLYDDGRPGELFITMSKEGSTIGGLMDCLGTAISVALQYGVPIESLVNKFAHQRFEPMGMTTNRDLPFAKSLVDYIFRWLGMRFIPGYREANAPKRPSNQVPAETPARAGQDVPGPSMKSPPVESGAKDGDSSPRPAITARSGNGDWRHLDPVPPASGHILAPHATEAAARAPESAVQRERSAALTAAAAIVAATTVLDISNAHLMGDAPPCDVCGLITVRSGNCYTCHSCGNSMGCS